MNETVQAYSQALVAARKVTDHFLIGVATGLIAVALTTSTTVRGATDKALAIVALLGAFGACCLLTSLLFHEHVLRNLQRAHTKYALAGTGASGSLSQDNARNSLTQEGQKYEEQAPWNARNALQRAGRALTLLSAALFVVGAVAEPFARAGWWP